MTTTRDVAGAEVGAVFARRVLLRQAMVGSVAFLVVNLLAPWSLMLEPHSLTRIWLTGLGVGIFAVALTGALSLPRMREARAVFRALALEPERMEAADIGTLANLPFALTARFVLVGAGAAALVVAGARPERLDDARALSLALLTFTIVAASAVVHYVVVRDATLRAIELSPPEPIGAWLERESMRLAPSKRVTRKILLAAVVPVALVGTGTVLVTQAHLRAAVERARHTTATYLARVALDPLEGALGEAGRDDAIAAAAAHGFVVQPRPGERIAEGAPPIERQAGGQLAARVPVSDGHAIVLYGAELTSGVVTVSAWIALLAVAVAGILGFAFGRAVSTDLVLATQQVSSLGTESIMRGTARVAGPARFAAVASLGRSVEALAERFRIFAAAQERALEARAAAQRMKQLLFASVSHDLKSPLNAILGFAEIVREERLSLAQLESLDMVSGRGRELLALIETILDAARVEAGEMQLLVQPVPPESLLQEAASKARDLHPGRGAPVVVELPPFLPHLLVDPAHASRSLAVLIAHALEGSQHAPGHPVRVRGTVPASEDGIPSGLVLLTIEHAAADDRLSLLQAQLEGQVPGSAGRGMVLRLGLARAIVELHGGRIEVGRGPHGAAVVTCWLPCAPASAYDEHEAPTLVLPPRG